jgi:tRNA threonylcarbamoyladenosine biosynthesis protein TsaB
MNFLAIETSTATGSVALGTEGSVTENVFTKGMHHGRELTARISALLEEKGMTLKDVDAIAVDIGPGSYTGLRVGAMTAKTLAFCNNIKLFPVVSLDILVRNVSFSRTDADHVCTLMDAKQGEVYFCLYENREGKWLRISDYLILPPEEALRRIPEGAAVIGDGILRVGQLISSSRHHVISEKEWRVSAQNALLVAARAFSPEKCRDPFELQPLYLRRPMAEVLWAKKGM